GTPPAAATCAAAIRGRTSASVRSGASRVSRSSGRTGRPRRFPAATRIRSWSCSKGRANRDGNHDDPEVAARIPRGTPSARLAGCRPRLVGLALGDGAGAAGGAGRGGGPGSVGGTGGGAGVEGATGLLRSRRGASWPGDAA